MFSSRALEILGVTGVADKAIYYATQFNTHHPLT